MAGNIHAKENQLLDTPVIEIEWLPKYAIGVAIIDDAHKELFRIASRLVTLSHDKSRHQWVGEQGVKYLKSYVVNHFSQEEAYMRSINYPGLPRHAEQHRLLREKILPRMENQLKHENYSEDAVEKFVNIIRLWISRHIMIHDLAISRLGNQGVETAS